jgi:hypothetical protein
VNHDLHLGLTAIASLSPFDNQSNIGSSVHQGEHAFQPVGASLKIGEQVQEAHIDWSDHQAL